MKDTILMGDVLEKLKELPEKSVDMCMTSPPYWALRDYGVDGQLGLEPTFQEYIKKLCVVFDGVKRVLKDEGTLWVNLGDTYNGSGKGAGGDITNSKQVWTFKTKEKKICNHCNKEFEGYKFQMFCGSACSGMDNTPRTKKGELPDKCLTLVTFRFAIAMVGRGWILRNTIIWHKRNCMPSSVKDRFTVDYEYIFFFSKQKKYYFEQQRVPTTEMYSEKRSKRPITSHGKEPTPSGNPNNLTYNKLSPLGRNHRCVWTINPKPFPEAHFAVYPEELCEIPIKAGCPEFVCHKCGKAREKIVENEQVKDDSDYRRDGRGIMGRSENQHGGLSGYKQTISNNKGLTNCKCKVGFSPGIVLDPFFGSGTTGLAAKKLGRHYVGIEINPEYVKIAEKRLNVWKGQTNLI